jgi:hypothetical protein
VNDPRIPTIDPACFSFRDLIGQDMWTAWSPSRTGWTDVGTPVVTGRFRVVGRQCFFQVKVTPGTTCATTAGTSYVALPLTAKGLAGDGSMSLDPNVYVGGCTIDITNSRCYVPTQAAVANTFIIGGWFEV